MNEGALRSRIQELEKENNILKNDIIDIVCAAELGTEQDVYTEINKKANTYQIDQGKWMREDITNQLYQLEKENTELKQKISDWEYHYELLDNENSMLKQTINNFRDEKKDV